MAAGIIGESCGQDLFLKSRSATVARQGGCMNVRKFIIAGGVLCLLLVGYLLLRASQSNNPNAKSSTVDVAKPIIPATVQPQAPIARTATPARSNEEATPVSKPNKTVWERSFGDYAVCCSTTEEDGEVLLQISQEALFEGHNHAPARILFPIVKPRLT